MLAEIPINKFKTSRYDVDTSNTLTAAPDCGNYLR